MASIPNSLCKFPVLLLLVLIFALGSQNCHGFQTFGFDIHHRFSDPVKGILPVDELPEKGSLTYYAALAHRDRIVRGRGLAGSDNEMLTFSDGNTTFRIASLGYLYYANVSLGTPSLPFLVALDTGSDLLWVPCDCISCGVSRLPDSGAELDLSIYSPKTSSTSQMVPCNSSLCKHRRGCSTRPNNCPYEVVYLSNGTSSSGILIEDVLHLTSYDNYPKFVDARITFGCGQIQTGSFLDGAAPNGLFGLGMDKVSAPSILASGGLAADSFSMCFGPDGIGRISFGDKGSPDQEETPFNLNQLHPTYNVSMTQIAVGTNVTDIDFSAIFDSGTSFTYLNDPAYTRISESFNSQVHDNRHPSDPRIPFEYCYDLSMNATDPVIPSINLTMKGGSQFSVYDPILFITTKAVYCLGVLKSTDVDIIGQNFMTGHRIVFNREKLVLGWKKSDCYDFENFSTLPVSPQNSPAVPPTIAVAPAVPPTFAVAPAVPPTIAVAPGSYSPEATKESGNSSRISGAPPPLKSLAPRLNALSFTFMMLIFPFSAIVSSFFLHHGPLY